MRGTLYPGSSPQEELEFAKTALALGQPVDVEALVEALEKTCKLVEEQDEKIEDLKLNLEDAENEVSELQAELQELEFEDEEVDGE